MKNLLLVIVCFFSVLLLNAQPQGVKWAKSMGGDFYDKGNAMVVDPSGNIYTVGSFQGKVDFDPSNGTCYLTTNDGDLRNPNGYCGIFITKLNANGDFVWAKKLGDSSYVYGMTEYGIALDKSGNIYTTGTFKGKMDFDPGIGTFNLTSNGLIDFFISKLDSSGNFIWAKKIGGAKDEYCKSIAIDNDGNIFTTGFFTGTVDFDPGVGVFNLTSFEGDLFISKLNSTGNFEWAKNIGGFTLDNRGSIRPNSVSLDGSGNIYCLGSFAGTVDFDPDSSALYSLISKGQFDIFILKLNQTGKFLWAKKIGGNENDWGKSICLDPFGFICIAGEFGGTVDFDPGIGENNLTSVADNSIFISKLDSLGNFVWAKKLDGTHWEEVYSIALDGSGNIYTTGEFYQTVDFDPGKEIFNLTSNSGSDIFISKLNTSGNFVWAKRMGGSNQDIGY